MTRYIAAVCPYCETKQVVDVAKLCREKKPPVVLGKKSRLKVECSNPDCPRHKFTIKIDCSEYQ